MSGEHSGDERDVAHPVIAAHVTGIAPPDGNQTEDEAEDEKAPVLAASPLWKRLRNTFIIAVLLWLVLLALRATSSKPKVVHANR